MKMFEYMASSKPIIASDLPSLREVLNENNALFFEADNPASLAETIRKCLNDQALSDKISTQAASDVRNYTWHTRVQTILAFIK
jgi:glycosyltransferase involved in cell wall biosynthesis